MTIDFRKTVFSGVAAQLDQCPPTVYPEVVLSGRSNVGKSSLINALAENRHLARISTTPGKTRLIVYFQVNSKLLLTDLPGYGFASASHQVKATFSSLADSYLTSGRPVALVLHLMDIRHEPSAADRQMIEWLQANKLPYQIVLTKIDKLSRSQLTQRLREWPDELEIADPGELMTFSANSRLGVDELRRRIEAVLQE